jgi:hypothetical protein
MHAFKCNYRKQLIQKAVAMMDGRLLQDATQIEDGCAVYNALHSRSLIIPTNIKNCFVKCGFSNDSNDDSAVKLSEDEEVDWHSLQSFSVLTEDYTTYNSALEVCGFQCDQ